MIESNEKQNCWLRFEFQSSHLIENHNNKETHALSLEEAGLEIAASQWPICRPNFTHGRQK